MEMGGKRIISERKHFYKAADWLLLNSWLAIKGVNLKKLWCCVGGWVIHPDKEQTLEISALETPNGGQFTLSTQFIKQNYLVIPPTDTASHFLHNLTLSLWGPSDWGSMFWALSWCFSPPIIIHGNSTPREMWQTVRLPVADKQYV